MTPIFASPAGGVVYVPASHGVDNLAEGLDKLKQQKLRFGSKGDTSLDLVPALAFQMLGLDVEVIMGFKSRATGRMSTLRCETTLDYQHTHDTRKPIGTSLDRGTLVTL